MSIIIRLQNLPWSANSVDIRRFFSGLSIPEGGVHIVGGEMGDAFIAFSTDEDARLAMAKDGGKIKDMQIKLLLSSRTEMMRVIEQARQQNMVVTQPHIVPQQPAILSLQQPARIMTPTSELDRRRGRSPSPRRRSRDRSPTRDRRRSPDDRRGSKRDRSRSPRSSRSFSRDMDRRNDRFKRDEKRYDDSRYRDDRRSSRDSSQEPKKYFDADHVNSRSQLHATEGFRNMQPSYEPATNMVMTGYPFGNQQSATVAKNFPDAYTRTSAESTSQLLPAERITPNKSMDFPSVSDQKLPLSGAYPQEQVPFNRPQFQSSISSAKELPVSSSEQQTQKSRRRTRFEPEFVPSSGSLPFNSSDKKTSNDNPHEPSYNGSRPLSGSYPQTRETWSQDVTANAENPTWNDKRQGLMDPPLSKNGDFVQVVPMDLDASPSDMTPEKEIYHETVPPRGPPPYARNNASPRRDNQNRGPPMHSDSDVRNDRGPVGHNDRGPVHNDRGPVHNDRGPVHSDRGPVHSDRGPVHSDRGPVHSDRGPVHNDRRGIALHGDKPGRVPSSLTVEVRGLPPDARIDHILDIFRGIPLPAANIRIEANDEGFEKAIIRFVSVSDYEEALSRNRRFMHEGRCELVPCPDSAFDTASRQQKSKPKPKPREEDMTIQMRGLPFSCKEDDIVRFFDGLGILDLYVDVAPDGRASGSGFVEFGTPEDFRAALAMNGKMIGHRYITISVASKELMTIVRGEDYNPVNHRDRPHSSVQYPGNNRPAYPPANAGRPPQPMRTPIGSIRPTLNPGRQPPPVNPNRPPPCVSLKNLPEGVTDGNIAEFLGQNGVRPRAVHIMLRPDKTPSGDAFVEFGSPGDMDRAMELNGKPMLGKRVMIQPISFHEMSEILGRPTPMPLPPAPPALLRTPSDMERPRRPLLSQGHGEGGFRERPRMEPPLRGGRPRMEVGPFGAARMRPPWPNRPPFNGGNRPEGRFPGPPSERGVKDFGAPGCVVSINNLHFRAGLEELLHFFQDYNITRDNVLRKYNENNQTTGEARVAFQTPRDAQRAVRELNQKPIMGRPLSLCIL